MSIGEAILNLVQRLAPPARVTAITKGLWEFWSRTFFTMSFKVLLKASFPKLLGNFRVWRIRHTLESNVESRADPQGDTVFSMPMRG